MNKNLIGTKCRKGFVIQSVKSNAGFYLGTTDELGFPNCRCSNYYTTQESLENSSMAQRNSAETQFCNGGLGCFVA